jgi:hypothetical protein
MAEDLNILEFLEESSKTCYLAKQSIFLLGAIHDQITCGEGTVVSSTHKLILPQDQMLCAAKKMLVFTAGILAACVCRSTSM